jgi:MoxR-like ATPase
MRVRLVTESTTLAENLGATLSAHGHEVETQLQPVRTYALVRTAAVKEDALRELLSHIAPLQPDLAVAAMLAGVDVEIRLGDERALSDWEVKILADTDAVGAALRGPLNALGFSDGGLSVSDPEELQLRYGGATPFVRQVLHWVMGREGITVPENKTWGDGDTDIWLYVRNPAFVGLPPKECFDVVVSVDDAAKAGALASALGEGGYDQVRTDHGLAAQFGLDLGPYARDAKAAADLERHVRVFLADHGVDEARYPLRVTRSSGLEATVSLPLAAHDAGELVPYAGAFPDRFLVTVRTDLADKTSSLVDELRDEGFTRLTTEELPGGVLAPAIRWGVASDIDEIRDVITDAVNALLDDVGIDPSTLLVSRPYDTEDPRVEIDLPIHTLTEATVEERIKAVSGEWDLALKAARPDDFSGLSDQLRELGFKTFNTEAASGVESPEIKYGGAPRALVEHVADIVERFTGVRPAINSVWGTEDDDIWIYLPSGADAAASDEAPPINLDAWFAELSGDAEPTAFLEFTADTVRIGDIVLPRRVGDEDVGLVPSRATMAHYCIDQRTAETLAHVAESVSMREPCLLEGETSVSKTSIIQYLGMLLNQPVVRINLNGQTDTGELIGRFLPQDVAQALPVDPDEMLAAEDLLEEESRFILRRAHDEGRQLTRVEVQQIMANERMTLHPWRWQDGMLISAMRKGWWVVLDELNLAEPQILERLNSVLERYPSVVLSEHDNSLIGPGGHPVHPNFRIFGTMNPAEYAGRSTLSPAYRDRWRGYRFVPSPGEAEYRAMLRYLVYGRQPDVHLRGRRFLGSAGGAPLGVLAEVPDMEAFLSALARFHAALEGAVGRNGGRSRLGARRRERYVFTRRGLLSVMDYLVTAVGDDSVDWRLSLRGALVRYYVGRVANAADAAVIVRLLDAAGIGPNTWTIGTRG